MDKKVIIGITFLTLIIMVGGIWLLTKQDAQQQIKLSKPLLGQEIPIQGRDHVPDGTTIVYSTNPPTSGNHYSTPQPAGVYDIFLPDGNLVHSLEHGAVILWYKPMSQSIQDQINTGSQSAQLAGLSPSDIDRLKQIFNSVSVNKKIMVPRESLDVPLALTSWGRLLKLQSIEENQIQSFMQTNEDRGPEQAPL